MQIAAVLLHIQWPLHKVNIWLLAVTQFLFKKETNGTFCLFEMSNIIHLKSRAWIFFLCVPPSLFVHQKATKCCHWIGSLLFISVNCYSRSWKEHISNTQQILEKSNQGTVGQLTFSQLYQHLCLCSWCAGQGQRTNPREKNDLFLLADFSDGFFSWKTVLWGVGRWGQWGETGQDPAGAAPEARKQQHGLQWLPSPCTDIGNDILHLSSFSVSLGTQRTLWGSTVQGRCFLSGRKRILPFLYLVKGRSRICVSDQSIKFSLGVSSSWQCTYHGG